MVLTTPQPRSARATAWAPAADARSGPCAAGARSAELGRFAGENRQSHLQTPASRRRLDAVLQRFAFHPRAIVPDGCQDAPCNGGRLAHGFLAAATGWVYLSARIENRGLTTRRVVLRERRFAGNGFPIELFQYRDKGQ